jgi:hypothetical protein
MTKTDRSPSIWKIAGCATALAFTPVMMASPASAYHHAAHHSVRHSFASAIAPGAYWRGGGDDYSPGHVQDYWVGSYGGVFVPRVEP